MVALIPVPIVLITVSFLVTNLSFCLLPFLLCLSFGFIFLL